MLLLTAYVLPHVRGFFIENTLHFCCVCRIIVLYLQRTLINTL